MKELWLKSLSAEIRKVSVIMEKDTHLERLARIADEVHKVSLNTTVSHILRASASSTSPTLIEKEFSDLKSQFSELSLQIQNLTKSRGRSSGRNFNRSASRSRSRSKKPGVCYYHRRFGDKAIRCTTPCTFRALDDDQGNESARQ